jgi:hypothetical protein
MTKSARPCAPTSADPAATSFEPWQVAFVERLVAGGGRFPTPAEQEYAARRQWRRWVAVHALAYELLRGGEVVRVAGSREEAERLYTEALAVVASCRRTR